MTERITTLMTSQLTINDINNSLNRLTRTQAELSSGKRVTKPSDDPYSASLAVQLQGELAGINAYSRNVTDGSGWTQTSDTALGSINNLVQRVRELVVQAGSGTSNQAELNAEATEVNQLIDAVKQEANTTYDGHYIFSGTATTTPPYQLGGADAYQGDAGTVNRTIGPGANVQINTDISQLLGNGQPAADGKLLDTLRGIVQNMQNGTPADITALQGTDLQNLDANLSALSQAQASVGSIENRLSLAASRIQDMQVSRTQMLSNATDVDMAQAAIDFSTEQSSFTAALQASAKIVQSSLLNFLS